MLLFRILVPCLGFFFLFCCFAAIVVWFRSGFHPIRSYVFRILIRHSNVIQADVSARLTRRANTRVVFVNYRSFLFLSVFYFSNFTNRFSNVIQADRLARSTDCATVFVVLVIKRVRHAARAIRRFRLFPIFKVLLNRFLARMCLSTNFRAHYRYASTVRRAAWMHVFFVFVFRGFRLSGIRTRDCTTYRWW